LRETLEDSTIRVDHPGAAQWFVHTGRPDSVVATRQWGIPKMPAHEIAQAILRKEQITIWETGPNRSRVVDGEATAIAADKARELDERFGEWLWEDPTRAAELAHVYNETFNNHVPRVHDGSYLTLPGLQLNFRPHAHQLAAIERIITDNAVGLGHAVGAGKTSEMIIGVMELRRLGFVQKPLVAVPKNVIAQFAAEWLQRYPRAKLLVAGQGDMTPQRRAAFQAKAASGDWDAILMTHQGLERIPTSADTRAKYLQRQVDEIQNMLDGAKGADMHHGTIKELAKRAARIAERVKAATDSPHDDGLTFEQCGFDYLVIDEGHLFKNLMLLTGLQDLMIQGSDRATDLHMKFEGLRSRGGRVGMMATATPFANKILAEMYNWQLFLDPAGFHERGIHSFEQFVATFGVDVTGLEIDLVGSLKVKTRLAALVNVPELMAAISRATDLKTAEDLDLATPALAMREDGKRLPRTIVIPPSAEHLDLMAELFERADDLRARHPQQQTERGVDNMYRIGNEGRYAALDLRLVGRRTDDTTKSDVVAANVYRIWEENRDNVYLDQQGQQQPHTGALQIVFCDLATPGPKGGPKFRLDDDGVQQAQWTFYHELRSQLAARGLPAAQVRFIHEAVTDEEKGQLFAACLNGQVAVLVGSTTMMGVGSNVQRRAIALHHVDPTWRPSDIEQRNGRILRQGNQNAEVEIYVYVTGQSVDAYMWQAVQRKAHTLDQALRGRGGVRVIDSPDDLVITAGMIKAAAIDNPLLVEKEELQARLAQLERRHKTHEAAQRAYAHTARTRGQDQQVYSAAATEAEAALAQRVNTRADAFAMTLHGHTYTARPDADAALHQLVADLEPGVRQRHVGEVGGFPILVSSTTHASTERRAVTFTLDGIPRSEVIIAATGFEYGHKVSLVSRVENRLYDLERSITTLHQAAADAAQEADRAKARIGQPFVDQADL
ncbi:MAG: hypothetical protein QOE61_4186, partial [Micromonosporaceae bacterium]|nr:hypothetical protein [Micromonosporaceae bacterium]